MITVSLNLPYSVVRGEQVVLQANVFNYLTSDVDVSTYDNNNNNNNNNNTCNNEKSNHTYIT
jgi:hypothetical protein